jgi:pyruvate kinase
MSLFFGVVPLLIKKEKDAETLFEEAIKASVAAGLVEKGDMVVLTAGVPLGISGKTNTIRAVEV